MPGEEKIIKKEGGEEVSKEDVRKDVLAVMAEEREKTAATENLGSIRKQVDHLEGEIGEVKKVLCAPGGGPCFTTQEQLDAYLKATDEKIGKIGAMLTEVVTKINTKPSKTEAPEGLTPLEPMSEEKRKASTERDNLARDEQFDKIINFFKATDNDLYRKIAKSKTNITNISKKPNIRKTVFDTATDEEIRGAMLIGCRDGKCKVLRSKLEAEEGLRIYQKDATGHFQPIDQEKKKDFFTP